MEPKNLTSEKEEFFIKKTAIRTMKKDIARLQREVVGTGLVSPQKAIELRLEKERIKKEEEEKRLRMEEETREKEEERIKTEEEEEEEKRIEEEKREEEEKKRRKLEEEQRKKEEEEKMRREEETRERMEIERLKAVAEEERKEAEGGERKKLEEEQKKEEGKKEIIKEERMEKEEIAREEKLEKEEPKTKKQALLEKIKRIREEGLKLKEIFKGFAIKKEPLESQKTALLEKLKEVERSFQIISTRERKIEETESLIEEKEAAAQTPGEKRRIEKERWEIEQKRQELEKRRWPLDEEIKQLDDQIKDIESKSRKIEAEGKELVKKQKEILQREEEIRLELEKIELEEEVQKIEQFKKSLEEKNLALFPELKKIEEKLSEVLAEEKEIEEEKKLIEEEEKSAKEPRERREFEKERWEIGEKRRKIETERWGLEEEKNKIEIQLKRNEKRLQTVLEKRDNIIGRIEEIERKLKGEGELEGETKKESTHLPVLERRERVKEIKKGIPIPPPPPPPPVFPPPPILPSSPAVTQSLISEEDKKRLEEAKRRIEALKKGVEEQRRRTEEQEEQKEKKESQQKRDEVEELATQEKVKTGYEEEKRRIEDEKLSSEEEKKWIDKEMERRRKEEEEAVKIKEEEKTRKEGERRRIFIKSEERRRELIERLKEKKKGVGKPLSPPPTPPSEIIRVISKKPTFIEKLWVRILFATIVIVILAGMGTFWYWFFRVRKQPPPSTCNTDVDCSVGQICGPEGQCIAVSTSAKCAADNDCQSGQTCSSEGVCMAVEPGLVVPLSLFSVDNTRTVTITSSEELRTLLTQSLQEWYNDNQFTRLVIKDTKENKILGLKEFFEKLLIRVSEDFYQRIDNNFTLFIYSQSEGNRLGFVAKIKNYEGLANLLRSQEATMENDFQPYFSLMGKEGAAIFPYFRNAENFQGYTGPNFRYQTLAREDFGILYLISGEYFVFTSSWKSTEKIIEKLGIIGVRIELTTELKLGDRGYEVELLQTWLAQDPTVYPERIINGNFGPKTKRAIIRFQEKYASEILAPQGLSKGNGIVDSYTRIKLNELYAESGVKPKVTELITDLRFGDHGQEVELLQTWLAKDKEVYPEKITSGYFGYLTQRAIIRFQEKYASEILTPQGLTRGTGIVDALTRKKLNELYGK